MNNNMSSAQARNQFPDLISQASYAKKRTVITRRGKKVAAIVPIEDLEYLQMIEKARDIKNLEEALKEGEFEDWEIVKKKLLTLHGLTEKQFDNMVAESKNVHTEDCEES